MEEVKRIHGIVKPACKDILRAEYKLHEGAASYQNHKTKAQDECYLFLLSSCLLLTNPLGDDGKHKLVVIMNLKSDIHVRDSDDKETVFHIITPKKTFDFTVGSREERDQWSMMMRFALEGLVPSAFKEVDGERVWDPRGTLSEEQLSKLDEFAGQVQEFVSSCDPPLDPEVVEWIDDATLLRFLRARQWVLKDSLVMITDSLKWRNEFKPHNTKIEEVERELFKGKLVVTPYRDKLDRPVVYYHTGLDQDPMDPVRVRYMMWLVEEAIRVADAKRTGMERSVWLVDFTGNKLKTGELKQTIAVSIEIIKLMQAHMPETLGKCFLLDAPTIFQMVWRAVTPFIDPVTQRKVIFAKKAKVVSDGTLQEFFDPDQLTEEYGGTAKWEWDLEKWKADRIAAGLKDIGGGATSSEAGDEAAPETEGEEGSAPA